MYKKYFTLVLFILGVCCFLFYSPVCNAQSYTREQMISLTEDYFASLDNQSVSTRTLPVIRYDSLFFQTQPYMVLCTQGDNWVIMANESRVPPVVCSGDGEIEIDMADTTNTLVVLLNETMMGLDAVKRSSNSYDEDDFRPLSASTTVMPLLDGVDPIRWGQNLNNGYQTDIDHSYNKFCPDFYNVSNDRALVGCTAVAMGQLMRYWEWPDYAYVPESINSIGMTSGSVQRFYDWNNMPGSIYNHTLMYQIDAVAGLLRDCGYAGDAWYLWDGTAMVLTDAKNALQDVFSYHTSNVAWYGIGYNFTDIIVEELVANRPVIIQATHNSDGGTHTFLIDGYRESSNQFHLNMGWWGMYNTWYSISGLHGYGEYTIGRRMLYDIWPDYSARENNVGVQNKTITQNTCASYVSKGNIRLTNNVSVLGGGHLIASAGNEIRLLPGFRAYANSDVRIYIRDYDVFPYPTYLWRAPASTEEETEDEWSEENWHELSMIAKEHGQVYPNPATDILFIPEDRVLRWEVYSLCGQKLYSGSDEMVDVSRLASGTYLLRYLTESNSQQTTFIKQ